jgi:hypothetical protein
MIYKESKISLTIGIISIGIIVPLITNYLFNRLFISLYNETNFNVAIHVLFFLIAIIACTQYDVKIVINNNEIVRNSMVGSRNIKWDEIVKVKYKKIFNKIYLYKSSGQYLMFNNKTINYKLLYKEIYEQIKLHNKESIIDKSFIRFLNSI